MLVVIDTNILVSAMWSRNGAPARVVSMIISGELIPCYDYRMLAEYREVLKRPKFQFSDGEINSLLEWIIDNGHSVIARSLDTIFTDKDDKKFYEVAKFCGARLITGNKKHFPDEEFILTASEFIQQCDLK